MISVIEPSCGTLLVTSIRFAELAATCQIMTRPAAVALSSIAVTADIEKFAAIRGMARSSTEDEFQGTSVPSRRRDSTTAPVSWQACSVSDYASFTELSGLDPDRYSGRGFFFSPAFVPPPYHELGLNKSPPRAKQSDTLIEATGATNKKPTEEKNAVSSPLWFPLRRSPLSVQRKTKHWPLIR
jgi:hypothetical protein